MNKIFLSYAHVDQPFASKIKESLREVGFSVWQDVDDLRSGEDWQYQIEKYIKESPAIILLLSSASVISKNVQFELEAAIRYKKAVLPILYEKCNIPKELEKIHYIDFIDQAKYPISLSKLVRDLSQVFPSSGFETDNLESIVQNAGNNSIQIGKAGNINIDL